ncbi:MAG TPA: hypothetical protein VIT62_16730 [Lysobacter sp.]
MDVLVSVLDGAVERRWVAVLLLIGAVGFVVLHWRRGAWLEAVTVVALLSSAYLCFVHRQAVALRARHGVSGAGPVTGSGQLPDIRDAEVHSHAACVKAGCTGGRPVGGFPRQTDTAR